MSYKVIHIFGASGSGTSTLGQELANLMNYRQYDTDDYYWETTDPPFTTVRPKDERIALLKKDIEAADKCIITGSLCGWGDVFIPTFDLVLRIIVPTEIRTRRLEQRERNRFGDRILVGGDMDDNHHKFMEWAKSYDTADINSRSKAMHDDWMNKITCKKITLDGTKSITENCAIIMEINL